AKLAQALPLFLCLDSFRNNLQPKDSAEPYHRFSKRRFRVALTVQACDERPVHLETVDREPLEICERRISGPEVVDRQSNSKRLECMQSLERRAIVVNQHRLRHFENEIVRRQSGFLERRRDIIDKLGLCEMASRKIHSHHQAHSRAANQRTEAFLPVARLAAGLFENQAAKGNYESRFFSERDEIERLEKAALRMSPSHQ